MLSETRPAPAQGDKGEKLPKGCAAGGDEYPYPTSEAASAVMRGNKKTNTRPELAVRRLVHARGLRYRVNCRVALPELKVRPDLVFSKAKVAVFIDGCFWHGCEEHGTRPRSNRTYWNSKIARNKERDTRIDAALRANGWVVLRAWEHEAPEVVAATIARTIRGPRSP